MDGSPDPELTAYLADRDVACPKCRYNLRGVTGGVCPECGVGLTTNLTIPGFGDAVKANRLALLLASVGWVLCAAAGWMAMSVLLAISKYYFPESVTWHDYAQKWLLSGGVVVFAVVMFLRRRGMGVRMMARRPPSARPWPPSVFYILLAFVAWLIVVVCVLVVGEALS
ncbi:MAG: hypothetical protein R3B49_07385 [Phycisphaerales bacterium]